MERLGGLIKRLEEVQIPFKVFKNGIVINGDCLQVIDYIDNFDHVLTDPPYGYLNHRIETFFDHKILFTKIREKINVKGAFLLFGRGDLFYEWNLYLRDIGFIHKEDCVLYKNNPPNIFGAMMRNGEYYSIRALEGFALNRVRIPITDTDNINDLQIADWHRQIEREGKQKKEVLEYLKTEKENRSEIFRSKEGVTIGKGAKTCQSVSALKSLLHGKVLSNVIIIDCFLGSGTTFISTIKTNRNKQSKRICIGIEIDKEYYNLSCNRIENEEEGYLF